MTAKRSRGEAEAEVLHPHRVVTLSNGLDVIVSPWGLEEGGRQTARVVSLVQKIQSGVGEAQRKQDAMTALLDHAQGDILQIVRHTVGWSDEELKANVQTFEDLLDLWTAVWETSLVKPEGGGTLPKVLRLLGQTTSAMNAASGSVR